jgi:uncharacterized protein YgiM (DUF1202 family)
MLLAVNGAFAVAWAETVFVQAKTAKLRSGKTSLDPVVADVKYGEALEVRKTEGTWLQVETRSGVTGWIFAGKTSTAKPSGADDELAKLGRTFRGREASDATASAGARGLDKVSEGYANRSGISQRDRDAVDRMTAYSVSDQEVEDFLKKGELGEYAK